MSAPEVQFHTGVTDPEVFVCRMLRKACRQGVRVQVTAPEEVLALLDRLLWTFEERDFVPHVRVAAVAQALASRTPIWLTPAALGADAPRVLLNLGAEAPPRPLELERIIEVVAAAPDEARRGRERWRQYKQIGLVVVHMPEPGLGSA
jgi:DNA polymerase III subunit chi